MYYKQTQSTPQGRARPARTQQHRGHEASRHRRDDCGDATATAPHENNADWLDGLAMLLRDEPDRYELDEDGYEDEDNLLDEHGLWTPVQERREATIELWHENEQA